MLKSPAARSTLAGAGCATLLTFTLAGPAPAATEGDPPADKPFTHATEPLESCMRRWDPGTHMTKEAWRQSCLRIRDERSPYVRNR